MKPRHPIVGVMLIVCGVALFLWSSTALAEHSPSPSDTMKTDSLTDAQKYNFQADDDKQQNVTSDTATPKTNVKTVVGELFRVDDANYYVKAKDGSEVRLHTDKTTNMKGKIKKGDQIKAKVNDQNHALSIQAVQ